MKPCYLLILLCAGHIGWAQAEIYKHIDADGHVTYSSSPMKGAKKLDLEPLSTTPLPARARSSETSPADFPRVDSNTQKSRDNTRRKILEDELAAEEKLLDDARRNLNNDEENPETSPKRMKSLQEQMSLHKKNVDALRSELANLK